MTSSDDFDRDVAEILRRPEVWRSDAGPLPVPAAILAIAALSSRLIAEDDAASERLDEIDKTPPVWWRTAIAKTPERNTAGLVRQLLERMRSFLVKAPLQALECTAIAVDVANAIAVTAYPGDFVISLRADAWRDHAYVLSFLGRSHEAIAAVDRAEQLLGQIPLPEFQAARTKLVRANIYRVTDRLAEAVGLAHEAGETFLAFGERSRYLNARTTEAMLLHEIGRVRDALVIWETIKDDQAMLETTHVQVVYDMGLAHRELGDLQKSTELITQSIAEYDLLGMDVEATRARWGLASTLVAAGRLSDAVPMLETAWKKFESFAIESDAALVALELAEVLLVVGQPERVPHICRELLDRFTRLGMTSRAITALSYLREVVAMGKAQPPIVRHVREFLRDLPLDGRSQLLLSPDDCSR